MVVYSNLLTRNMPEICFPFRFSLYMQHLHLNTRWHSTDKDFFVGFCTHLSPSFLSMSCLNLWAPPPVALITLVSVLTRWSLMKSKHVSMYAFSNLIKCRRAVTSSCTDISYSLSLGASYDETKTQDISTAFASRTWPVALNQKIAT